MRWTNWRTGKRRFRRGGHNRWRNCRVSFVACTADARLLGAGIGLVSVSPWSKQRPVTTFGILTAAWFIAVQLFASGVGGYLAGRLRTRWVSVHTEEVYFRDTTHGLIVWGVGAIVTAWLLASGVASVVSGAAHAGASALEAAGTATGTRRASRRPSGLKRGKFGGLFHRHAVSH
jgi:MFS family permease